LVDDIGNLTLLTYGSNQKLSDELPENHLDNWHFNGYRYEQIGMNSQKTISEEFHLKYLKPTIYLKTENYGISKRWKSLLRCIRKSLKKP
jgi:hypothetical protein